MEYNVSKETALVIGDKLSDAAGNKFIVRDLHRKNTYSQYASLVLIECYEGPRKNQVRWVSHDLAIQYRTKAMSWQPISTAPVRKRILLWSDWKGGWGNVEVSYVDPRYVGHPEYKYTYWMDLPEPPKGKRNRKD